MQSGAYVVGALLLPEGQFDSEGNYTMHGTIISERMWLRGGATIMMDECWVENIPGPFLQARLAGWAEVDR
jgi:hypothetical protein